ncbi:Vacuolar ATPase assembly integral membrane protein vma21, partial [Penicillium alfredii]
HSSIPATDMSARRPHAQSYADAAAKPPPEKSDSDVTPAVPADVIYKLLSFTAAMVIGPLGVYFLTVNSIFSGNTTFAGIAAAFTANVVLFAYVFVAWKDDQGERQATEKEKSKKAQ